MKSVLRNVFAVLVWMAAYWAPVRADTQFRAHLKGQVIHGEYDSKDVVSVLGPDRTTDGTFEFRPMLESTTGHFAFVLHGELLGTAGDVTRVRQQELRAVPSLFGALSARLPYDDGRAVDLTADLIDERSSELEARIDRLSVAYTTDQLVLRAGRQAITWGNGLAFQVLDPFNPFSPTETDKDYKSGEDMLFGQWLFAGGSDMQILGVLRRDFKSREIESDVSSFALKWRSQVEGVEFDLLGAAHCGEPWLGVGLSREVLEAVTRFDVAYTDLAEEGSRVSFLVNVDQGFSVGEKSFYAFVEYFRSGVGTNDYASPPHSLVERIERGEVFTLGRDYVGAGLRAQIDDRAQILPLTIWNLHDESLLAQIVTAIDTSQNSWVQFGMNFPIGSRGSEFGGFDVAGSGVTRPSGAQVFVRGAYFF